MELFATVVGVSFRGSEAKEYVKSLTPDDGDKLSLEPEPDNPYDDHAVKVMAATLAGPMHIGYIARENNQALHEALVDGRSFEIEIIGFESTIKPTLLIREMADAD